MSVIVRMEMPDWCPCELAIDNNGWFSPCFAYDGIPSRDKEFDDCVENRKRPSWCPIIRELPEQHGDLIDKDALLEECYPDDEFDAHVIYADDIHKAKAIVPATERSER